MKFQENVSLADQTNFKIGGPTKYFFVTRSKKDLIEAIKKIKKFKIPFYVLGGGNNVLALDRGYNGLIIKIANFQFLIRNCRIHAGAGLNLAKLVNLTADKSLTGLEWAAGIPGTVGGAVYGNAQAFGNKMSEIVKEVEVFNIKTSRVRTFKKRDCKFSEKESIFKKKKNLIILSVILELKRGNKNNIERKIKKHISFRKKNQPLKFPSAGSVFVNQLGKPASSYLIDRAGLKGRKIGAAQVSEKHAGFIINKGGAKARDVLKLIKIIKKEVKKKFKVSLKEEIQIIK